MLWWWSLGLTVDNNFVFLTYSIFYQVSQKCLKDEKTTRFPLSFPCPSLDLPKEAKEILRQPEGNEEDSRGSTTPSLNELSPSRTDTQPQTHSTSASLPGWKRTIQFSCRIQYSTPLLKSTGELQPRSPCAISCREGWLLWPRASMRRGSRRTSRYLVGFWAAGGWQKHTVFPRMGYLGGSQCVYGQSLSPCIFYAYMCYI